MTDAANPFLNGVRIRVEKERISPFKGSAGMVFVKTTETRTQGAGNLETLVNAPSVFLPEGTRVSSAQEVSHQCYKFAKGLSGCGPMTKDGVRWCARCKRPFCARHTWQVLFSTNRYCWGCLVVRSIETLLGSITGLAKSLFRLVAACWKAWNGLFR